MTIVKYSDLSDLREKYKGKKIVYGTGVFDVTHAGHVLFLEDCKKQGDVLVVSVVKDSFIKGYKRNPVLNEHVRLKMVDSLKPVDYVVLDQTETYGPEGYMGDIQSIIHELKPDVFVINSDVQYIEERREKIEKMGVKFVVLDRACPEEFEKISTTRIIDKMSRKES